jgi:hypothetical protein
MSDGFLICLSAAIACASTFYLGKQYGSASERKAGHGQGQNKWLNTPKDVRPKKNRRYSLVSDGGTKVRVVAADSERVMFVSDEDNIVHEVPAASFADCFKECE